VDRFEAGDMWDSLISEVDRQTLDGVLCGCSVESFVVDECRGEGEEGEVEVRAAFVAG